MLSVQLGKLLLYFVIKNRKALTIKLKTVYYCLNFVV